MIKRCSFCIWHRVYFDDGISDGCSCTHNIGDIEDPDYHVCYETSFDELDKETDCPYFELDE